MPEPASRAFAYSVVRVVPRVERGESLNAGVVLFCRQLDFLAARVGVDPERLAALAPETSEHVVSRHLDAIVRIAAGDPGAGPLAALSPSERFGWLVAPSSTIIQTSTVHTGLSGDPAATLEELYADLVRRPVAPVVPGQDSWEQRLETLWASLGELGDDTFLAAIETLLGELPADSPLAPFELACAFDSTGHPDRAVPLYREALERGLEGERRRRAVIQMASSLRNLGEIGESVALLRAEREAGTDGLDDAVTAFLALALADEGSEREALSLALSALAGHLPRYQRSLANYADELGDS